MDTYVSRDFGHGVALAKVQRDGIDMDATQIVLGDLEWTTDPDEAREIATALLDAADALDRAGRGD